MADIESNVKVNIDTSDALAQLKLLQQQISAFQQAMRKAGADNALAARQMQQNLANSINATGKFQANIQTIQTSAERFTGALEKNKLSMGEYFRYAGGASKTFGKLFKSEFETINQVARERVKSLQTQYIKLGRDANGAMKAIAVRPLALDMENLGTKTQMAAQRQQLFNQLMKQGSTNLLNFGKNTQWAGRQLMVGFTVPLTLMGSAAAKAYMEIEKASVSLRRVYGDMNTTTDETEKMVLSVRAMANEFTKYGVSVSDTMEMAAKAAAMGKTGADLLAQISQANKLAVLGNVDQNQALETTISLTNAFGVSTVDLSKNIDFLNAVENQTVTSIEDLTIAIPKAAPVVKQLGGDVEDLAFFLTAMKEGGINASEGANALKSGLASMINPSKKASDFLASFGISVKGIVEANKGDVKGTVIGMAKAFDTLDPLNRARAIEQLFGKFQFSRISTLFQNVIKEGSQANTVAGLANQTAEELSVLSEREMKKISDSPMYKFQKSIQDMQAKLAPVGEAFLKAVTPIIGFVTKILDGFNNLSDGTKSFITILVTAVAGIGPLLLMTFGLIANGVANIMKLFTNMKGFINKTTKPSDILGEQTGYMSSEQLKGAAIAASLDQAHAKLRQTFTSEAGAVNELATAYRNAIQAQQQFSGVPNVPVGNPNIAPKKYANGVSMVPGPNGAGDIVPALLSPGEAVIPAKSAKKYAPVIAGMIAGNLPGFENGTPGAGMRQSIYGPLTQRQTDGLGRTGLQLKDISDEVMAGPYGKVPPTDFGTQISPTSGHSFPAFEVGGIYQKPDGTRVFVKPQMDLTSALAEQRGTTIARDAHGLVAPKQEIRVMMDPTDPENSRRFIVLESALDDKIANIPQTFTKDQYFKQLVASLLRGDKDLGVGNLGGDVLADVGPAGVFGRASGKRALGSAINSMEEQAIINLLGVKGGAKRFFATATKDIAAKMTPEEYDAAMKAEIGSVLPKLESTIIGFGQMSPDEAQAYKNMLLRLKQGQTTDWRKYQAIHAGVKLSGGGKVARGKTAMEILNEALGIQESHLQGAMDPKDPEVMKQLQRVHGKNVTAEDYKNFEVLGNLTMSLPGIVNQRLKSGGMQSQQFLQVYSALTGKLSKTALRAGIKDMSISQQLENMIGQRAALDATVTDPSLGKATSSTLSDASVMSGPLGGAANLLLARARQVGTVRSKLDLSEGSQHDIFLGMLQRGEIKPNKTGTEFNTTFGARMARWRMPGGTGAKSTAEDKKLRIASQQALSAWMASGANPNSLPVVNFNGNSYPLKLRTNSAGAGSFGTSSGAEQVAYDQNKKGFEGNLGLAQGGAEFLRSILGLPMNGFADGTSKVIARAKPKASVFDIDDTLLDLSSFMTAHQAENDKLPEDQKKKWYKEVAKDPKGIPAGLAALKAAQARGNKILLMTARPDFYEPYTIETLQKLGIDMNGIKLIARQDKDYRKPEQMKYDKTSAYMKYYDIEEFYDDMAKTRGAVSLLGIPTYNPLKLAGGGMVPGYANGVFSVPGPKGAGDVVPAMLTPGEAVIPADKAEKHRGLIGQMISGNLPGYNKGTAGIPGYGKGIPGVPEPTSSEPEKGPGFLDKFKTSVSGAADKLLDSAKKAGQVLKEKSLDAAETIGVEVVKVLNAGTSSTVDRKGNVRFDAKTGETKDKKGNVVAKEGKNVKDEEVVLKDKGSNIELTREQIEEQMSLTDKDYEQALQRQQQLKLLSVLSDKEKEQLAKDQELINKKEEAWLQERGASEKKKSKGAGFFTRSQATGKVQTAMYGASGALGAASMIPGQVGQAAQAMLPAVGAMTSAMAMIPGPAGIVAGALMAAGTVFMQVQAHLAALRDEVIKTTKAMGTSNEAIQKFAEFSKKVSGTEAMNKQRSNSAGQFFNVVEGKTTFGESYMKTDAGKELVKDVSKSISSGGLDNAKQLITNQLSAAVASGVMNTQQARSIAANLGVAIGNTSFGISVAGSLTELMGPEGENLLTDPLTIRAKIVAESVEQVDKAATKLTTAGTDYRSKGTIKGVSNIATYGGIGMGIGAAAGLIGGPLAPLTSTAGAVIGGLLGMAAGAVHDFVNAEGLAVQAATELQTAVSNTFDVQQQMVDSLDISYQKRIAEAEAAGDTAEAARLQKQYTEEQGKLLESNSKTTKDMYAELAKADDGFFGMGGNQNKLSDAANKQIENAYKDSGREDEAKKVQEAIDNAQGNKTQKTALKTLVGNKQLGLTQAKTAVEMYGTSEKGMNRLQSLMETSPVEANRALGLAGNMGPEAGKQFLNTLTAKDAKTGKRMGAQEVSKTVTAMETVQRTTGVFDEKTGKSMMKFMVDPKNHKELLKFQADVDKLKKNKKIDIKVAGEFLGANLMKHIKDKDFQKYFGKAKNATTKATFMTEYKQIMLQEGNKDVQAAFETWKAENGNSKKSFADYAAFQADRTVTTSGQDNTATPKPKNTGGSGGPAASWLDQYVNAIRDVSNQSQGLTTGIKASGSALAKFGATKNKFGGLIYDLKKAGASNDIIKAALGGDEATTYALIDKKTGQLKAGAAKILKGIKAAIAAAKIGDWLTSGAEGQNQSRIETYTSGLDVIKSKEDDINKAYDERQTALDEISKLNDRNNQQQQDALSLADALSKGDIAAAARAAQQARQNDQTAALADAKDSLENERKKELADITVQMGKATFTRAQLEAKIAGYSKESAQAKADELYTQLRLNEAAGSDKFPVIKRAMGGLIAPKGYAVGGGIYGTDTVPAMLTPGEFVIRKSAVDNIGVGALTSINQGEVPTSGGDSVYNINVSVSSNASPDQIAQAVMQKIQSIDNQRIRGSRL